MASRQGRSNRIYNWHAAPWQIDARISIGSSGAPTLVTSSTITGSNPSASTQQSQGIKSITRLATGIYRVQLDDNYTSLLQADARFTAPVTGGAVNVDATDAALSVGTIYQIVTLGVQTAANWITLGVPAGVTPAVGVVFKAAATGAGTQSGTGTVKAIGTNSAGRIELLGTPDLMLNNQPFTQGSGGGYITFQCIATAPVGTNSAPALTMNSYTPAGTITNGTPDTFSGTPATLTGTVAAPTFTGTAPIAADPSNGSTMYLRFLLSNSSVG